MDYRITLVSDQLVYIRWFCVPEEASSEAQFLHDFKQILDSAPQPLYFISDLRDGRLDNIETIQKLAEMTAHHANYAGGTSFSQDAYTSMFVGLFSKYAHHVRKTSELWPTLDLALSFLENLAPGVTQGIDWESLLQTPA